MTFEVLTKELPTEEHLANTRPAIKAESDRGAVIMCSAMVEQALDHTLRRFLPHLTEDEHKEWFEGALSPFSSFSAKIKLGRGLEIYHSDVEAELNLIRKIRNAFAHRSLPLNFEHEALQEAFEELLGGLGEWPAMTKREIFAAYCLGTTNVLRSVRPKT